MFTKTIFYSKKTVITEVNGKKLIMPHEKAVVIELIRRMDK